ncbi:hypothetical protein ACTWQB_16235 [Piscibacillus sp. B03]|uniref:hypothetical protein n=1 Tax=Piscibacillus sp. B03 TaxID=3457430 RepID=UPI003FCDC6BC
MGNHLAMILLLPLILWSTFQGILYSHATQVEETLMMAIYEGQKEAALQGRYDESIYQTMESFLVDTHGYDPDVIEITGTEDVVPRGERLEVSVTIPQPITHVMDLFRFSDLKDTYTVSKTIMSEFNPS